MTCLKCGGFDCSPERCVEEIFSLYHCECRICKTPHKSMQKICIDCLRGEHKWL